MTTPFATLWNEPRVPDAPLPSRRDRVLVAALVLASVAEHAFDEDMAWRPLSAVLTVALVAMLPWRRVHPLGTVALAFGAITAVQALALLRGAEWSGAITTVSLLLLPYALLRWGSGREATLGLGVVAAAFASALPFGDMGWGDMLGAGLFLFFPAALGAAVRYRDSGHRRALEQVRSRERERLARELHDTVAHHVSAIAVRAQAGRALASERPDAPLEALGVIEEAASRTLDEMRRMVHVLRDGTSAARAPGATLADIERLAGSGACPLPMDVVLDGELAELDAVLESTLHDLAREALTNAVRHARSASRITVHVIGEDERVRLRVVDDGRGAGASAREGEDGFGLRGMRERVALLGGTFTAGPRDTDRADGAHGWVVEATLPRRRARS